ncbi:hypothetical protein CIJ84_03235 [Neisseria meningitidis]|uniref:Uncharacterized protein n=1 Tax=Neisseria meningitidis TaxID=487 RepID=A0AB37KBU3_NEIME|nr:hypothetical protein CIJ82_02715 [Neisseria meningitidis]RGA70789.1 hypothetical protein CIJ72_01895 [Neisseria meningitidis]RGA72954.1 hypothetical protein CIJ68_02030 [Neisseria meningitidis]RGA93380.1 hypothetical protein CIJ67_01880 [Neisseria meningitidis]RGA97907.1 hypothetical protein CIJ76_02065 [Neisseria meningitidis]
MRTDLDSHLCGNDDAEVARNSKKKRNRTNRIPAFAGMTGFWVVVIYRENGNPYAVIPAQAGI